MAVGSGQNRWLLMISMACLAVFSVGLIATWRGIGAAESDLESARLHAALARLHNDAALLQARLIDANRLIETVLMPTSYVIALRLIESPSKAHARVSIPTMLIERESSGHWGM